MTEPTNPGGDEQLPDVEETPGDTDTDNGDDDGDQDEQPDTPPAFRDVGEHHIEQPEDPS
jgi:hypothetical protein